MCVKCAAERKTEGKNTSDGSQNPQGPGGWPGRWSLRGSQAQAEAQTDQQEETQEESARNDPPPPGGLEERKRIAKVQFRNISGRLGWKNLNDDISVLRQFQGDEFAIGHRVQKFLSDQLNARTPGLIDGDFP